jgi:hypothetical protein
VRPRADKNNNILKEKSDRRKNIWVLTPILGTLLFVVLYVDATLLYPGGSQINNNSVGFSWTNNYWCNLLSEKAINGQPNPAKPVAVTGMIILCLTLSLFWFIFPRHIDSGKPGRLIIQISGTFAMTTAALLLTDINHDLVTNLASLFGLIATAGTFVGLYRNKWYGLFGFGLVNILLVGLNNYFYYSKEFIIYLPVIQKISFAVFLLWICCITINIFLRPEIEIPSARGLV